LSDSRSRASVRNATSPPITTITISLQNVREPLDGEKRRQRERVDVAPACAAIDSSRGAAWSWRVLGGAEQARE
jgi:hypothetical protein